MTALAPSPLAEGRDPATDRVVPPPKPPRARRPPRPPRRVVLDVPREPLTPRQRFFRVTAVMALVLIGSFLVDVFVLSHLQHLVSQQQLMNTFRAQLAAGTAPVSEGDPLGQLLDDGTPANLLEDGAPVALLDIPAVGIHEVVVEGTSSGDLMRGPGHRRDTSLPGQVGTSIVMGRAAAYGGPFSRIQELAPGETFSVITGQGTSDFQVMGVRYAGDAMPPGLVSGQGRLILESARGPAFMPSGIVYVDAALVSTPLPKGVRQTTVGGLDAQDFPMKSDTSTVWALVFALQLLAATEILVVLALPRVGAQRVWVAAAPVAVIGLVIASTQVALLLPNLM